MRILTVNLDKCTGCRTCELICSMKNVKEFNPVKARIHIMSFFERGFFFPVVCFQCAEPLCAQICPSGAITKDELTGIVKVSEQRCVGCKMCILACPFGNIVFSGKDGRAVKCDLCDGEPECVSVCVTGALEFKEADIAITSKKRVLAEKLKEVYR